MLKGGQMQITEPTAAEYMDKALTILRGMRRQLKRRRINVLRARVALAEIVAASKYTTPEDDEHDEREAA